MVTKMTKEIQKVRKDLSKINKLLIRTPHPLYLVKRNALEKKLSELEEKRARA